MGNLTQQQIEALIQFIDGAEDPATVTNTIVAAVLAFLADKTAGMATAQALLEEIATRQTADTDLLSRINQLQQLIQSIGAVIYLDSMGEELDGRPVHIDPGMVIYDPNNLTIKKCTAPDTYVDIGCDENVLYCNKASNILYRWQPKAYSMLKIGGGGGGMGVGVSFADGITNIIISSSGGGGGGGDIPTEVTASPTISVETSGLNKMVTISNNDESEDVNIYYTIDGSEPTKNSSQYSTPIAISASGTTTIKAIAVASGKLPSASVSADVYIEPNEWLTDKAFGQNGNIIDNVGYSISPYIPCSNGDTIWVWLGLPYSYDNGLNTKVTIAIYDSNKDYLGGYFAVNYHRLFTLSTSGAAYVRFVSPSNVREKTIAKKFNAAPTTNIDGSILYHGSEIGSTDVPYYDNICPCVYLSNTTGNFGPKEWTTQRQDKYRGIALPKLDFSKYTKIKFHHGTADMDAQKFVFALQWDTTNGAWVGYYNNGYAQSGTTVFPDPRVWSMPIEGYYGLQLLIDAADLHECYIEGTFTEGGEEKTEYIWRGCNPTIPT